MIVAQANLFPNAFFSFQVGKLYLVERHCYFHKTQDGFDYNINGGGYFEYKFDDFKATLYVPGKIITPDEIEYVVCAGNIILCLEFGKETEISKKYDFETIKILYKEKVGWTGFPRGQHPYFFSEK